MRERKPIDGALRRFLDEQAAASGNLAAVRMDEARARIMRELMVRVLASRESIPGLPNEVETREVLIAPGLAARLYRPNGIALLLPCWCTCTAAVGLRGRSRHLTHSAVS